MITFDPEFPWHVGQYVTFREDDDTWVMVVEKAEFAEKVTNNDDDHTLEMQYSFVHQRVWELRQAGVRPYIELDQ